MVTLHLLNVVEALEIRADTNQIPEHQQRLRRGV